MTEKEADVARLAQLQATKDSLSKASELEAHLRELCGRIIADLDNCTCQDKKDAYAYLDLRVTATPEAVEIKGYVQPKLITTGQTSALSRERNCPCRWAVPRPGWTAWLPQGQPVTA